MSSRRARANEPAMGSSRASARVSVVLRCRPLNAKERAEKVPEVIAVDESARTASVTPRGGGSSGERAGAERASATREFSFDDVFGPSSTQERVYDAAVRPMVRDVLEGMNCTVFAYGQTGTGKTHTMSGARDAECDVLSQDAGVIPRAMSQLFEHLESKELEHSVKVTYLELYNEEITDLLGPPAEEASSSASSASSAAGKVKHALMEDGKGGVAVKGLEEVYVGSTEEVFAVLNRGNARRRTEETLLNKHSSRSHSVFSVTVHVKDVSPDGEEFVRCGKLNLVDLAGSENISRSGAKEKRAKEAGEINKSLVALGRVITALVDKSAHVPYRDSKLTRLLRDALGGRCKTCIIATVSPASHSVEETLSTLEYAHRAKNIKNKPLMNGKIPKSVFMKELQDCIERLQDDLLATREKNGVFMSKSNYDAEQSEHASARRRAEELENALASMQVEHDKVTRMFDKTKKNFLQLKEQNAEVESELGATKESLETTTRELRSAERDTRDKEFLLSTLEQTHEDMSSATRAMVRDMSAARGEVDALFEKVSRQQSVMDSNADAVRELGASVNERLETLERGLAGVQDVERVARDRIKTVLEEFMIRKEREVNELKESLATTQRAVERAARSASDHARESMLKHADALTHAAEELRAGAEATAEAAVQAVVASRRGCDETVESLDQSLASDRAAFTDLADTVASTSERGVADFMSKHAADLTSIRERFTTDLSTAIRADAPTGTTPARESARALLAEPVTPSAFRFHRDDVLRRRPTVDGKPPPSSASRPPLSPIN